MGTNEQSMGITGQTMNITKRIGFACKWAEINKKGEIVSAEGLNTGGTTQAWAKRNNRNVVEEKIMDVAKRNIMNTHALVKKVATLEPELRMLRLTSDMFSFYTMDGYKEFWHSSDVQNSLQRWMAPIGANQRCKLFCTSVLCQNSLYPSIV